MKPYTPASAKLIIKQRTNPSLFLFSYLAVRSHLKTFRCFAEKFTDPALVLDAGCGYMPWQRLLSSQVKYVGVDYSSNFSAPNALASVDALPFPDSTFDGIICTEVLEHTRFPNSCIDELRRVCKPGGLLYITSPFAFPEHGIPYDYQRLTQYFYRDVFSADEIISLSPTNSVLGTAFTSFNFFIECSPLKKIWGVRHLVYPICNIAGLFFDYLADVVGPRVIKDSRLYTHPFPLGYNMIIRIVKK